MVLDRRGRVIHTHAETEVPIEGTRIEVGEVLRPDDRYASTDGHWQRCPSGLVGATLENSEVQWIRPEAKAAPVSNSGAANFMAFAASAMWDDDD